jgi:hypothetical protein
MVINPPFSLVWAMPNRHTFEIPPIAAFLDKWLAGCKHILDPMCGKSTRGTCRNDWRYDGMDAEEFCESILSESYDAVLFDPPYSPRQIQECYRAIGIDYSTPQTQNAALYARVRKQLDRILMPGGIALSFGWNSIGMCKPYITEEVLLVQHGGAHNDTICVAQRKPSQSTSKGDA